MVVPMTEMLYLGHLVVIVNVFVCVCVRVCVCVGKKRVPLPLMEQEGHYRVLLRFKNRINANR